MYIYRRYFQRRSRHERTSAHRNWMLYNVLLIFRREPVVRRETVDLAVAQEDLYVVCLAQVRRRFD